MPAVQGARVAWAEDAASARSAASSDSVAEYRLRFLNFNMANSSTFRGFGDLQGPGGRGLFEAALTDPLADGGAPDLAFITLVETRLPVSDWLQQHLAKRMFPLDVTVYQNACREGAKNSDSQAHGWLQGLAANYNGNLKSVLAFSSRCFTESEAASLYGRFWELKVAGLAVPNPKKAFIGRTLVEHVQGVRLCFAGAHFPIGGIAATLDAPCADKAGALPSVKTALARTLRKVLRKACRQGIVDGNTVIIVQGDLNSRTVLGSCGARDALLEVLADEALQAAIQTDLPMPPGAWHEMAEYSQASSLPVTYKFRECPGDAFREPVRGTAAPGRTFTIGDVMKAAGARWLEAAASCEGPELYRRALQSIPSEQLGAWGVTFKEKDFRPFRFPACADRIVYWAPHALAARMSWSLPRGGYEVNHHQRGSDHRPVSLEVLLRIAPPPAQSVKAADAASSPRGVAGAASPNAPAELVRAVSQLDGEDSGCEAPDQPLRLGGALAGLAAAASWQLPRPP